MGDENRTSGIKAPATQDFVLCPQQLQLQFQKARSDKAFTGIPVTSTTVQEHIALQQS